MGDLDGKEYLKLCDLRQALVLKDFDKGLTKREKSNLAEIDARLNEIEMDHIYGHEHG